MQGHLKCWLWRLVSLLWAQCKFNCCINGLRKAEKMSMTMLALVARARQQLMKTSKQWRKWFWLIVVVTIREVADDVGISFGSCQAIFTNVLGIKHAAAKLVPKLINLSKNNTDIVQEMLATFNDVPDLLKMIPTGNESWVYAYDIETKAQSSQWKRPEETKPKKAPQVRSNVKVLLTFFRFPGRPSTSTTDENIEAVMKMILEDWGEMSRTMLVLIALARQHPIQMILDNRRRHY